MFLQRSSAEEKRVSMSRSLLFLDSMGPSSTWGNERANVQYKYRSKRMIFETAQNRPYLDVVTSTGNQSNPLTFWNRTKPYITYHFLVNISAFSCCLLGTLWEQNRVDAAWKDVFAPRNVNKFPFPATREQACVDLSESHVGSLFVSDLDMRVDRSPLPTVASLRWPYTAGRWTEPIILHLLRTRSTVLIDSRCVKFFIRTSAGVAMRKHH